MSTSDCPICGRSFPLRLIEAHASECLSTAAYATPSKVASTSGATNGTSGVATTSSTAAAVHSERKGEAFILSADAHAGVGVTDVIETAQQSYLPWISLWNAIQSHSPPDSSSVVLTSKSPPSPLAPDIWLIPASPPCGPPTTSSTSISNHTNNASSTPKPNNDINKINNANNTNNGITESDNSAIGAHRLVLCTMSASLHRTISSMSLPSTIGNGISDGVCSGTNVSRLAVSERAPVVRAALQFCYTGRVSVATRWLLPLHRLASVWAIPTLSASVSLAITSSITSNESVATMMESCSDIGDDHTWERCAEYICNHAQILLVSATFLADISMANLSLLLQRDDLAVSELLVFKAIRLWCRLRSTPRVSDGFDDLQFRQLVAPKSVVGVDDDDGATHHVNGDVKSRAGDTGTASRFGYVNNISAVDSVTYARNQPLASEIRAKRISQAIDEDTLYDIDELRQVSASLLPHFRLSLLSVDELMNAVRPADLIPAATLLEAVAYLLEKPSVIPLSSSSTPSSTRPFPISVARKGIEEMVSRGGSLNTSSGGWGYSGPADILSVRVSKRISLLGVGVHVPVGVGTYEISIYDGARRIAAPSTLRTVGTEEPKTPTRMNLNPVVTLDANRSYVIAIVQRGKNTPSVNGCSSRVTQCGVEWTFTTVTSNQTGLGDNGTSESRGQLPSFWFKVLHY